MAHCRFDARHAAAERVQAVLRGNDVLQDARASAHEASQQHVGAVQVPQTGRQLRREQRVALGALKRDARELSQAFLVVDRVMASHLEARLGNGLAIDDALDRISYHGRVGQAHAPPLGIGAVEGSPVNRHRPVVPVVLRRALGQGSPVDRQRLRAAVVLHRVVSQSLNHLQLAQQLEDDVGDICAVQRPRLAELHQRRGIVRDDGGARCRQQSRKERRAAHRCGGGDRRRLTRVR
mmetsp:Transcript_61280/g.142547  ORF Transcript_61280/g.142547 Transcript_61280/m.142547 type:complete len:236 (-) Transcript_61280:43-750(-)